MQKTTKLGAALIGAGTGATLVMTEASDHGAHGLAVVSAVTSGACTALGAAALLIGWAVRRPGDRADRV